MSKPLDSPKEIVDKLNTKLEAQIKQINTSYATSNINRQQALDEIAFIYEGYWKDLLTNLSQY